eukprot:398416-Prorocentrum_minimum.AAC.2
MLGSEQGPSFGSAKREICEGSSGRRLSLASTSPRPTTGAYRPPPPLTRVQRAAPGGGGGVLEGALMVHPPPFTRAQGAAPGGGGCVLEGVPLFGRVEWGPEGRQGGGGGGEEGGGGGGGGGGACGVARHSFGPLAKAPCAGGGGVRPEDHHTCAARLARVVIC